ncbi:MAG: thioredoxin domain-containing protein [Gammaproteobacteria bacterium]|nr:thioredoxin domain-containing protein [Gammaproteobacteria bacterium]
MYTIRILIRYLLTMAGSVAIAVFAVTAIADQTPPGSTAEIPTDYAIDDPPGADSLSVSLRRDLALAVARLGDDYVPRTEYLRDDGQPRYTNRLALEDSPYLLQHAHNPVNWYPWGDEAMAAARQAQKPIFLSIGYSTCHWCHVMERESFDNETIARLLNENFIAIKVDREQRPDIDEIYMTAVQMISGQGGWPMSNFLMPDGKPFYGGTYFNPEQFSELLERVMTVWETQRDMLADNAGVVTDNLKLVLNSTQQGPAITAETIERAIAEVLAEYDSEWGGFGIGPKFPRESELLMLLRAAQRDGNAEALSAADKTLEAMAQGGIFDQIGGGFHRYATDRRWVVPHFEKTLYNQALLARAYTIGFQITGKPQHRRVAKQTFAYVLRDMRHSDGGFYSATDADSEGREGAFFVWTAEQLDRELEADDARLAKSVFGITAHGNFEGANILHLPESLEDYASRHDRPIDALRSQLDRIRDRLRRARDRRERPLRDEKVLTAWNGMMITTLAIASDVLGTPEYLRAATDAAAFLWNRNRDDQGRLYRINSNGRRSISATQEDYAYLSEALITLYDVTGDRLWLNRAVNLARTMLALFWDESYGGFFMVSNRYDPHLIIRPKNSQDGSIPSGSSVAVRVLAMLAQRTDYDEFSKKIAATLASHAAFIDKYPSAFSYMLAGADEWFSGAVGARQYAARGHITVQAVITEADSVTMRLRLQLAMDNDWLVPARGASATGMTAIDVALDGNSPWRLASIQYPKPRDASIGAESVPVYRGNVELTAQLEHRTGITSSPPIPIVPLTVRLQSCHTGACLEPESVRLELPHQPVPF